MVSMTGLAPIAPGTPGSRMFSVVMMGSDSEDQKALDFSSSDRWAWEFGGAASMSLTGYSLTSHYPMTELVTDSPWTPTAWRQMVHSMSTSWDPPPPDERRLMNALELDRAEIGFDAIAAGILGRLYDLGRASETDIADWFQSADQWIAFSRLQRCRYVEDLGSQFTLSREGYAFVEDLLAEDATA